MKRIAMSCSQKKQFWFFKLRQIRAMFLIAGAFNSSAVALCNVTNSTCAIEVSELKEVKALFVKEERLQISLDVKPSSVVEYPKAIMISADVSGGAEPYVKKAWGGACDGVESSTCTITKIGIHTVTYTVEDSDGETLTASKTVEIKKVSNTKPNRGGGGGSMSAELPLQKLKKFLDVPATHTYAKEIEYMKAKGISVGFNNGSEYRPDTTIDRKSLVTLVVKAKYSESEINSCIADNGYTGKNIFHDVPSTHHFAPFICMAKVNQIAIGYSTGYFGVDEAIKADAAIKIVMRTLDKNLEIALDSPLPEYTKRLNNLGYYPPTIRTEKESLHEATRGEVAYMTQIINDSYTRLVGTNIR
jgi:hypothetical protein